jgi:hypothetical protein
MLLEDGFFVGVGSKMFNPRFPERVNLTGTALPALATFKTPLLSTGLKNPCQS